MSKIRNLDRITEAYSGAMGKEFGEKTRSRINWIVNQVYGYKILDIGCSQGIIPIILGREGKRVDAIDIAEESIQYALDQIKDEHQTVRENVSFRVSNFSSDYTLHSDYETILLTEVLEHIAEPNGFLKKIDSHLMNGGNLVVTVPFGINDYFDHKRTYYFLDLYDQLSAHFEIEKIEYLGNWVGVVCKKNELVKVSDKKETFTRNILEQLESAFYKLEKSLITRITDFQAIIQDKNGYINNLQIQHQNQIRELKELMNREENASISDELKKQNENLISLINNINEHSKWNAMKSAEYVQKKEEKIIELEEKIDLYRNTILMDSIDIEKKGSEIKLLTLTNSKVEADKAKVEQKLEEALVENKNLKKLEETIASLQKTILDYTLDMEKKDSEVVQLTLTNSKVEADKTQIEQKLEEALVENKNLKKLEETIASLQKTILDHTLDMEKKDSEVVQLTLTNSKVEADKTQIEQKLEEALVENKNLKKLEETIASLQKTILDHTLDMEKKDSEIKWLTLSNSEKENEKIRIEQKLEKALMENKNLLKLEKEVASERIKIGELEGEIIKLKQLNEKIMIEKQNSPTASLERYARSLEEKLNVSLDNEEKALKYILKIKEEVNKYENRIEKLEKKNDLLERRYLALKNSKLGNLTLRYWDARRKLRR